MTAVLFGITFLSLHNLRVHTDMKWTISCLKFMYRMWIIMKFCLFCSDDCNWRRDASRQDPIERQRLLCTQIDRLQTMQTRGLAVDVPVRSWETCLSYLQIWWVSVIRDSLKKLGPSQPTCSFRISSKLFSEPLNDYNDHNDYGSSRTVLTTFRELREVPLVFPTITFSFHSLFSYIIRMKEYEREKRLLRRNQRIEKAAA